MLILSFGNVQLHLHQFAQHVLQRVHGRVHVFGGVGRECGDVRRLQDALQAGDGRVSRGLQSTKLRGELHFLGLQFGGEVRRPLLLDVFARQRHGLQALGWRHGTVAHLVRGVDDVDGVGV